MRKSARTRLLILTVLVGLVCLTALLAPVLAPWDPYAADTANLLSPPSLAHPLGTDDLGRDELSRLLIGLRTSLGSAFLVVCAANLLGALLGTSAGFIGGPADGVVLWLITTFQAFPSLLLALVIAGFTGGGWQNACFALIAVYWSSSARLARSIVLAEREKPYVAGAWMSGCGAAQVLLGHIFPNVLPQIIANAVSQVGSVIVSMAALSFLGVGVQRPTSEWGVMLSEAQKLLRKAPQLLVCISVSLVLLVLLFNLFGDALRDWLDRRLEQAS